MATVNATFGTLTLIGNNANVSRTNIIWPETIPNYFFARNYSQTPREQFIRSNVDIGLAQIRRRYTEPILDIQGSMRLSQTQLDELCSWYDTILEGGTKTFNMTNPLNDQVRTCRFKKSFTANHEGGEYYQVSMQMEIVSCL